MTTPRTRRCVDRVGRENEVPNGDERNWSRFCFTIAGFREAHGCWPSRVLLPEDLLRDIESLMAPESFRKLNERIKIVTRDGDIVAEDDSGHTYVYGTAWPDYQEVEGWLGVTADKLYG